MDDNGDAEVTCSSCGRTYLCTPDDDYYNATTTTDGICESCLLAEIGASEIIEVDALDEIDISEWNLPYAISDKGALVSYDGQVYDRCVACGAEVRTSAEFAADRPVGDWKCRDCNRSTTHERVIHGLRSDAVCLDCGTPFSTVGAWHAPLRCPSCESRRIEINSLDFDPPFPPTCEQGFGWPEETAAPEIFEQVWNRERHVWGRTPYDDVEQLTRELQMWSSMPEFPDHLTLASRFAWRLRHFAEYDQAGRVQLASFEAHLLQEVFRRTRAAEYAMRSADLSRDVIDAADTPIREYIEKRSLAYTLFSLLQEFGDLVLRLETQWPDARAEAIRLAQEALDFFKTTDDIDADVRRSEAAELQLLLAGLLSQDSGSGEVLDAARESIPRLGSMMSTLENAGLVDDRLFWQPSFDDLSLALEYATQAIESGALPPPLQMVARHSRAVVILRMGDAANADARRTAIDDLEGVVRDGTNPQGWIPLGNLSRLHLARGEVAKAVAYAEQACSLAFLEIRRTYDESSLDTRGLEFVRYFDDLALMYAQAGRGVDAMCTLEALRSAPLRAHTMSGAEKLRVSDKRQRQREVDAVRFILRSMGRDVERPSVPSLQEELDDIRRQVEHDVVGALDDARVGFVNFAIGTASVLATILVGKSEEGLCVRTHEWPTDTANLYLKCQMTPLDPGGLRSRRLEALADLAYASLWRPLEDVLGDLHIEAVVISAPSALSGITFEALLDRQSESAVPIGQVTYLPSIRLAADVLARRAPSDATRGPRRVLAVKYEGPDLPNAAEEINQLRKVLGSGLTVVDAATSGKREILSLLGAEWDLVHFACHGTFDETDPWQSALHLRSDPQNDSHRLTAEDISTVSFASSPVIVLSACSSLVTSSSPLCDGAGLTGAFLRGGASGIVASHWPVFDDTALEFMRTFYSAWANGKGAAAALKQGQDKLRQDHPIDDWAAFSYVGLPTSAG